MTAVQHRLEYNEGWHAKEGNLKKHEHSLKIVSEDRQDLHMWREKEATNNDKCLDCIWKTKTMDHTQSDTSTVSNASCHLFDIKYSSLQSLRILKAL